MKTTIISKVPITGIELTEVKKYLGEDVTVIKTSAVFMTERLNGKLFGDFNWLRSQFLDKCDNRIFVTSQADLQSKGITDHLAAVDISDGDAVSDVYIGLEPTLDPRAKRNGFTCNLAWEVVHELTHATEEKYGNQYKKDKDRTHDAEMKGDLKVLYNEGMVIIPRLIEQKNILMQWAISLATEQLKKLLLQQKKTMEIKKSVYEIALMYIGTDASPKDLANDEVGCAETVTTILKQYDQSIPILLGTATLKEYMDSSAKFKKTTIPKQGTIIVCPTAPGHPFPGHAGIFFDQKRIASNDSKTGKFLQNYELRSWIIRWVDKGKYKIYLYDLI